MGGSGGDSEDRKQVKKVKEGDARRQLSNVSDVSGYSERLSHQYTAQ